MSGVRCRYVERRLGDIARDGLDEAEGARVALHLGECAKCRRTVRTWQGFESFVRTTEMPGLPPLVERRYLIAALTGREPESASAKRATPHPSLALIGAGLAAAAAVAIFVISTNPNASQSDSPARVATERAQAPTERTRDALAPEATDETSMTPAVVSNRDDERLFVESSPGVRLWIAENSVLSTKVITGSTARFYLARGHVVAEVTTDIPGYRFIVETPRGEVEAKGTVFSVEARPNGEQIARVIEGFVEVRGHARGSDVSRHYLLHSGQQGSVGAQNAEVADAAHLRVDHCLLDGCEAAEPKPTEGEDEAPRASRSRRLQGVKPKGEPPRKKERADGPQSEPGQMAARNRIDTLTALALEQRKRGQYLTAAETYERIIDLEAGKASANALVSLGQLELVELERYRSAISHFEQYLDRHPKGYLAEEARLGRVRAYTAMRNARGIISAASDYLEHHEGGYAGAEVLLMRADARRKMGDCQGAVADYRKLQSLWPASRQNAAVEKGLRLCDRHP